MRCVVLCCIALRCVALHCIALRCFALRCVVLCCVALYSVALRCVALYCVVLDLIGLDCILVEYCSENSKQNDTSQSTTILYPLLEQTATVHEAIQKQTGQILYSSMVI